MAEVDIDQIERALQRKQLAEWAASPPAPNYSGQWDEYLASLANRREDARVREFVREHAVSEATAQRVLGVPAWALRAKELMVDHKISESDLGMKCGLDVNELRRILDGRREATDGQLVRIAAALRVPVTALTDEPREPSVFAVVHGYEPK